MEPLGRPTPIPDLSTRDILLLAGVFLLLIGLRVPALTGVINLSHDATEYIDIARNFAAGEGLVLKIRGYFFGDGLTLPYPASSLRSLLFPILMGSAYSIAPSILVFQWFNFVVFLLNLVLLAQILRPVLPGWLIAYSLLLVGLSEPMFLTSIFPWAEQTAFFWLLTVMLMVSREVHVRWGATGALLEGLAAAMAAMSRPEYVLAGVLLLIWHALRRERRRVLCWWVLAGFLLPLAGMSALNLHQFGRLFLPGEYLFRSRHYASYFAWEDAGSQKAGAFLAANWLWILRQILLNAVNYVAKLIGWKNLFFLSAALPFAIRHGLCSRIDWRRRQLVMVPGLFLCAYCMIWAGMDRERYLLAVTSFWLPLSLLEVNGWRMRAQRTWMRIACISLMAVNLPLFVARTVTADVVIRDRTGLGERFYARQNPAWSNPDLQKLSDWVRDNVGRNEVVCLENPFLLNYTTGRLTLALPEQIRASEFTSFLSFYRVRYWVNNSVYSKRSVELLSDLRGAAQKTGAREITRCGTYEVWQIP